MAWIYKKHKIMAVWVAYRLSDPLQQQWAIEGTFTPVVGGDSCCDEFILVLFPTKMSVKRWINKRIQQKQQDTTP